MNKGVIIGIIIGIIIVGILVVYSMDSETKTEIDIPISESGEPVGKKYTVELNENFGVNEP